MFVPRNEEERLVEKRAEKRVWWIGFVSEHITQQEQIWGRVIKVTFFHFFAERMEGRRTENRYKRIESRD
jgi:hypothetical protein